MYVYPDVESLEAVEADDSKCQTLFFIGEAMTKKPQRFWGVRDSRDGKSDGKAACCNHPIGTNIGTWSAEACRQTIEIRSEGQAQAWTIMNHFNIEQQVWGLQKVFSVFSLI